MKKIILASKSTDRREIFKRLKIPFEILITNIDEQKYKTSFINPIELVKELAKAKALYAKENQLKNKLDAVIIAADTIVECDGDIIGKANNKREAFEILKKLEGKAHNLITGIAITETNNPKIIVDSDTTVVEFLNLTSEEIEDYIKTNEWVGRAGAYSIRDKASFFINKINGSTSNVIGLPMHKIYYIMRNEFGLNLFRTD
ncbi:hypothetical protein LCGC14_1196320 [marine sediment metagenome]|uniref:Septum formation protein Maf n=1 Tax=marine sediment metagenome TaxID=412755 RepID=A0A0F9LMM9_9ZZZZ